MRTSTTLAALVLVVAASSGCGELAREGRSPVQVVIQSLEGAHRTAVKQGLLAREQSIPNPMVLGCQLVPMLGHRPIGGGAGRRGMAAVLWPGRPSLAAHPLRHLSPQKWPKSSLEAVEQFQFVRLANLQSVTRAVEA